MSEDLKKTPLHAWHLEHGGRMVPFAGYAMPIQYKTGLMREHHAVRQSSGLFDVSHMGEFVAEGPGALDALNYALSNNIAALEDGEALYTILCNEEGGIVDDLIVYREHQNRYFLCVNASRKAEDWSQLQKASVGFDLLWTDVSDAWGQIAFQGPKALDILGALCGRLPERGFTFVDAQLAGVDGVRIAQTGYTGEPGVELYVPAEQTLKVWNALLSEGGDEVMACGLGARDTLRLEMKYPLYGQDIGLDTNPLEAGLRFAVKLKKADFVGKAALLEVLAQGLNRKWVGFKLLGRGVPRAGYSVYSEEALVGTVTSGTHSPSLKMGIGAAYIDATHCELGTKLDLEVRGQRVPIEISKTPFYSKQGL